MKKIYLGVGHGGKDSGAVGYIVEKDVNLQMALACKEYLEANGVEVKISRISDIDKDLTQRIKECNAYGPDLAVDVHNNAGGGDGFEVYHTLSGGTGKVLAQNIEEEIKAIGQNSRGLKTRVNSQGKDYFGFIRQIKCPSIITETVFVDNEADASQADELEEQKIFGQAIAKGILKTLNIEISNSGQSTATTVTENQNVATYTHKDFVKEVQACIGAKVDGIAGKETLSKTITVSKRKNSRHAVVKPIQKYLNTLGFNCGQVDGIAGTLFDNAVKSYQKANGCVVDGIINARCLTWKKLLEIS